MTTDNHKREYENLLVKARLGDVTSQYDIGAYTLCGIGVEPNKCEAIEWFEKAAKGGSYLACQFLASILYTAESSESDKKLARHWYGVGKELIKDLDHSFWDIYIEEFES